MKHFAELAGIVTKYKSKKIDLIYHEGNQQGNKYAELAESLAENAEITDEDAARIMGSAPNSSAFRMFKLRFREKLLNSLILSDITLITPYAKSIVQVNRNLFCARILILLSARTSAKDLLQQTLKKAIEFHLSEIAMLCCFELRRICTYHTDNREFYYYKDLYHKYADCYRAEIKASEYYDAVILKAHNNYVFKKDNLEFLDDQVEEIKALMATYDTYQLGLNYYRLAALNKYMAQDYMASLTIWEEMSAFINRFSHFEYNTRQGEILLQKMNLFLYLHDYNKGLHCAEQCSSVFKPGTNNWFIFNEILFILAVHTRNYTQAGQIIEQVNHTTQFKFQDEDKKERWRIFEAYYFILLKAGVARQYSNSRFRFSSFLNSLSIYTKDKKGFNTSILILDMIYHLLNKEFPLITEKMDGLKRYSKRHFEGQGNFRSHIFMNLLIECERYEFNRDVILKKTKKMQEKLASTQFSYISSLDGIEIVPFTDLWKIVCDNLE